MCVTRVRVKRPGGGPGVFVSFHPVGSRAARSRFEAKPGFNDRSLSREEN